MPQITFFSVLERPGKNCKEGFQSLPLGQTSVKAIVHLTRNKSCFFCFISVDNATTTTPMPTTMQASEIENGNHYTYHYKYVSPYNCIKITLCHDENGLHKTNHGCFVFCPQMIQRLPRPCLQLCQHLKFKMVIIMLITTNMYRRIIVSK